MRDDLESAMLLVNDWLGQIVRLLIVIRDGASPDELPPSGPARGWHVLLAHQARLRRPDVTTDYERQLTIGTCGLGDDTLCKLLLDDLPRERIVVVSDDKLAVYLPGSFVVLVLERLPE